LCAWLHDLPDDHVPAAFTDVEEIIGIPLPPSCRRHAPHWSSYDGSAVVRAIHDADWIATKDLYFALIRSYSSCMCAWSLSSILQDLAGHG
jgi:hypothetical protein